MGRYGYLLLLELLTLSSFAQDQPAYIQSFDQNLSGRLKFSMPFLTLNRHTANGTFRFKPNNPLRIGVGLALKNTLIDFTLGSKFNFLRDKKKGKTESFDLQVHHYGSRFVLDFTVQKYRGFYTEDRPGKNIGLYPDLKILQYGLHGQYIFNHRRFSYKAAFIQSEQQIRQAGTALIGGCIYFTEMEPDSSFREEMGNRFNNFQFGINGGYAYTWVLGAHWFISASLSLGINLGNEDIRHFTKRKIEVYPAAFQRVAIGYNRDNWSIGFNSVHNLTFLSSSFHKGSSLYSGKIQLTYIRRFYFSRKPFRIRSQKITE